MGYYDRDRSPPGKGPTYDRDAAGTMNYPTTYIGNTAEYLVAGWPYVKTIENPDSTERTHTINFNYVTSELKIQANNEDITISLQGSTDTFVVAENTTMTLPVKCTTLSFTVDGNGDGITVIAALTNIPASQYPPSDDGWVGATVTVDPAITP